MKKHTTLPLDYTTLISETLAHLNSIGDLEGTEYKENAWHWLGMKSELEGSIPSLNTTFSSQSFVVRGVGHRAVNNDLLNNNIAGDNVLLVPLMDCENTVVKIFSVNSGATLVADTYYQDSDCVLLETIPLTNAIFLQSNTVYTIERLTSDTTLSDVLMVYFDGDTNSLFAE